MGSTGRKTRQERSRQSLRTRPRLRGEPPRAAIEQAGLRCYVEPLDDDINDQPSSQETRARIR
jgi:hypothetical protein